MKTAIVYYSMGGNTAYIAARIAKKLAANVDVIELTPVKAYPDKGFKKFLWGGPKSRLLCRIHSTQVIMNRLFWAFLYGQAVQHRPYAHSQRRTRSC